MVGLLGNADRGEHGNPTRDAKENCRKSCRNHEQSIRSPSSDATIATTIVVAIVAKSAVFPPWIVYLREPDQRELAIPVEAAIVVPHESTIIHHRRRLARFARV